MLHFLFRYIVYIIITLIVSLKAQSPELFINEFLSSNSSINLDSDFYSFCDWIEIYNSGDTVVNISGYYITDDLSNPFKFQFPDSSIIHPNSFLLFGLMMKIIILGIITYIQKILI